jgi:hypothetical protein
VTNDISCYIIFLSCIGIHTFVSKKVNSMTRFLAIIRRIALAGLISLVICIALQEIGFTKVFGLAISSEPMQFQKAFSIYILVSVPAYVVLNLLSCVYIRRHGQFAAVHQQQAFIVSVFRALGHDLFAPFKNLGGLFTAIFNRYPDIMPADMVKKSKRISVCRFFESVILILFCLAGIGSLL